MTLDTLAVYTRDDIDTIRASGVTGDWRMDAKGIPNIKYLMIVSQNPIDRGCVRVLAKVREITRAVVPPLWKPRFQVHFDEFVEPRHFIKWGSTSPIRYFDSRILPVDVIKTNWRMVVDERWRKLEVYEQMIALELNVPVEKVLVSVAD